MLERRDRDRHARARMTGISESGTRHFAIDSSNWGSGYSWGLAIAACV